MNEHSRVCASHVSKRDGYGFVKDICLEVSEGEVLALSGENGSGKTLLLKLLAGLLIPDRGEVSICGMSMREHPHHAKRFIGYAPEIHGYYDSMKLREYLEYYAATMNLSGLTARKRIDELLEMFGLGQCSNEFIDAVSSGTKQRLSLARCLLNDPQVLLLDEPQNYLDPQGRALFRQLCQNYINEGRSVIVCSHNLLQMDGIATSIAVMKKGCLLEKKELKVIKEEGKKNSPLIITLADIKDVSRAVLLLRAINAVDRLSVEGSVISLYLKENSADDRYILSELIKNSIATVSFGRKETNLEELFIDLYK